MREAVKHLSTKWVGRPLHTFDTVGSTNAVLATLAAGSAPPGATVCAAFQSAGRGRLKRRWLAPPNTSLLFSVLFRPAWPARQAHWLTMLAGLSVVAAVEKHTALQLALKWPNDIMLYDDAHAPAQWCKTGGILLETTLGEEQLQQAIVGIGLNVNIARRDLPAADTPATSLLAAGGRRVDRAVLLAGILQELETRYEQADAGRSPQPAWDVRLITRDRQVRVRDGERIIEGKALGSDEWGRILVRDADGAVHAISAGDVTLREPASST